MPLIRRVLTPRGLLDLPHKRLAAALLAVGGLGFGGCAQSPQQLAAGPSHGKEYFPSSVYGRASQRVIADGQPIPRGGGQYLVGRPYTIAGQTYYPSERRIVQVGKASWYGDAFHGRYTANGEIYDRDSFTAAHPTMPLPSYARVTNLANHYSMIVRVNDRGPYAAGRIMDVSRRVAEALDFKRSGTGTVKVEYVGRASLAGSDDAKLYATLRQDGPARFQGEAPTMVAEAAPRARVASIAPFVPAPVAEPVRSEPTRPRRVATLERDAATLQALRREARETTHVEPARRTRVAEREDRVEEAHAARYAVQEMRHAPLPPTRVASARSIGAVLPPSRPVDLGTIPGAGSQIGRRHVASLHMARTRDDD